MSMPRKRKYLLQGIIFAQPILVFAAPGVEVFLAFGGRVSERVGAMVADGGAEASIDVRPGFVSQLFGTFLNTIASSQTAHLGVLRSQLVLNNIKLLSWSVSGPEQKERCRRTYSKHGGRATKQDGEQVGENHDVLLC